MIPAGTVQNGSGTLSVRTDAQFTSVEDIRSTLIPLPTGGSVRLDEIADVSMTQKEVSDIAKVNGNSCCAAHHQQAVRCQHRGGARARLRRPWSSWPAQLFGRFGLLRDGPEGLHRPLGGQRRAEHRAGRAAGRHGAALLPARRRRNPWSSPSPCRCASSRSFCSCRCSTSRST